MIDVGNHTAPSAGVFRRLFRSRCRENARSSGDGTGSVSRIEENRVVRIKMVVKKADLAEFLESMGGGGGGGRGSPALISVEQRLAAVRRKQILRARLAAASWSPALHSIPEEIDEENHRLRN